MNILCKSCVFWVNCSKPDKKNYGFCLVRDLFTYTAKTKCSDYTKGKPMTEQEYEEIK